MDDDFDKESVMLELASHDASDIDEEGDDNYEASEEEASIIYRTYEYRKTIPDDTLYCGRFNSMRFTVG
ncbi:hypothetical protein CHS0354_016747 [Potamilus streckersoni]|uniref:Uncharacterized protein n=1 Tax=Potamilus streckersoni TaxID=2493646 RepID=A0AAE0TCI3_9BIVA|nr:hypothetical protein CHS0354_016747 [Potamilus streckersoni]